MRSLYFYKNLTYFLEKPETESTSNIVDRIF